MPDNREPGSLPLELTQLSEDHDDEQIFVPADVADDIETPEQVQERIRWEQEEYEREQYARNYASAQHARNQSSPSAAYDRSPDSETHSRQSTGASGYSNDTTVAEDKRTQRASPVPDSVVPGNAQVSPVNVARPSTPVHSPAFNDHRASTPTQGRSLVYHMNGDSSSSDTAFE